MLTKEQAIKHRRREIQERFRNAKLDFVISASFPDVELWVNVLDSTNIDELTAYCKEVESRPLDSEVPVTIFVKKWIGPWPGGITEEELQARRAKLPERIKELLSHS